MARGRVFQMVKVWRKPGGTVPGPDGNARTEWVPAKEGDEGAKQKWIRAPKKYRGEGTYFIEYNDPRGKRVTEATEATSKPEAEGLLKAKHGNNVKAEILGISNPEALDTTMKDFLEKTYLPSIRNENRPGTIENYERYAKLLIERFGNMKLRLIGRPEVDAFYDDLKENGKTDWDTKMSTATANRIISFLRSTFYKAMERGVSDRNPCARIGLKDEENERRTTLKRHQEPLLMEKADAWLKPIIETAVQSGLRLSELLDLQWADSCTDFKAHKLDLEDGVFDISSASKSGKKRRVPIPPDLHKMLSKLERWTGPDGETSAYVFPNAKGERLHKRTVQAAFEKACKEAKVWDLHFHDLRRTFASRKVEDGESLPTVAALLGHGSTYVTERYTWMEDEHLRKAMGQPAKRSEAELARFRQDGGNDGKATG